MTKEIQISAAREIAKKYDWPVIAIIGIEPETGMQHVTTYGKTIRHCKFVAEFGNNLKRKMGWPEEMCHASPNLSVTEIAEKIAAEKRAKSRDELLKQRAIERARILYCLEVAEEKLEELSKSTFAGIRDFAIKALAEINKIKNGEEK